jgi:hypothetical protein
MMISKLNSMIGQKWDLPFDDKLDSDFKRFIIRISMGKRFRT